MKTFPPFLYLILQHIMWWWPKENNLHNCSLNAGTQLTLQLNTKTTRRTSTTRSSRSWTTFTLIPKKRVKQRRVTKKMKANKCFVMESVWIWRVGINQKAADDDSARIQMSWWLLAQIEDSQSQLLCFWIHMYLDVIRRENCQLKYLTTDQRLWS